MRSSIPASFCTLEMITSLTTPRDDARELIARRAGNGRDNRSLLAGKGIKQAALARIGRPDQHDARPVPGLAAR